ncbi:hypothetical protein JCM16814_05160 [Desulfobaculum senezii]|jgi:phage shock protein B
MHHIGFWIILLPLVVVLVIIFILGKLFHGAFSRSEPQEQVDETRMIQEMFASLNRLEERMDVLETLLYEQEGQSKGNRDARKDA